MTIIKDSLKLTTDYNKLIEQYEKGVSLSSAYCSLPRPYEYANSVDTEEYAIALKNSKYMTKNGKVKFPIIVEAWHVKGKPIMIDDHADKMYEPPVYLQVNTDKIMNAHKSSTLYNNVALRIDDVKTRDDIITLSTSRTTYFASLLTNRAMDYHFNDGPTVRQMYEYDFHTPPLRESQLSNHLGVNGIIFTLDDIAVFVNRNKNVSIGKESYGTGVAGSIKARYAIDRSLGVCPMTIRAAIMQEIIDEMRLDPREYSMLNFSIEQNLIAFYRDLVEGGKPQFLIDCKLPLTFEELSKRISNQNNTSDDILADGDQIVGIRKADLRNATIIPDGISARTITGDVQFLPMMPSASASIAMHLQ